MQFLIEHTTEYTYSAPATEAFSELRLRPRDNLKQRVTRHATSVQPAVVVDSYTDYFGNIVEAIAVPFRHSALTVTSLCQVRTFATNDALSGLDLSISEAMAVSHEKRRELHDFLRPSAFIHFDQQVRSMAQELLPRSANFSEALDGLNRHIFTRYRYRPGSTDVTTTVPQFLASGEGVCQDFTHLMIALCRAAGIPARYVSGYIESDPPPGDVQRNDPELIGSAASHAWLEVYAPNGMWIGFDPTNNMREGERHVQIGIGRDYADVPPLKGIFKGSQKQKLSVQVRVLRSDAVTAEE
jgi:transglutaminase-like putative cysteine protease